MPVEEILLGDAPTQSSTQEIDLGNVQTQSGVQEIDLGNVEEPQNVVSIAAHYILKYGLRPALGIDLGKPTPKRFVQQIWNMGVAQPIHALAEDPEENHAMMKAHEVFAEITKGKELSYEFKNQLYKDLYKELLLPPGQRETPELRKYRQFTPGQKPPLTVKPQDTGIPFINEVVDIGAGLSTFVGQLAITKRFLPGNTPTALIWEIQNLLTGGKPGKGATMYALYGTGGKIGEKIASKIPGKGLLSKIARFAVKPAPTSLIFEEQARLSGATPTERMIQAGIPYGFAVLDLAHQRTIDIKPTESAPEIKQILDTTQGIKDVVDTSETLTPQEKAFAQKYIGDIETKTVKTVVDKFPDPVTDQESLERVGNAIKEHLGITQDIKWVWSNRVVKKKMGTHDQGTIIVYGKAPSHIRDGQPQIKDTIIHELGHLETVRPPILKGKLFEFPGDAKIRLSSIGDGVYRVRYGGKFYRVKGTSSESAAKEKFVKYYNEGRQVHHPEFVKWVNDSVKKLYEEQTKKLPVERPENLGTDPRIQKLGDLVEEAKNYQVGSPEHTRLKAEAMDLALKINPDSATWRQAFPTMSEFLGQEGLETLRKANLANAEAEKSAPEKGGGIETPTEYFFNKEKPIKTMTIAERTDKNVPQRKITLEEYKDRLLAQEGQQIRVLESQPDVPHELAKMAIIRAKLGDIKLAKEELQSAETFAKKYKTTSPLIDEARKTIQEAELHPTPPQAQTQGEKLIYKGGAYRYETGTEIHPDAKTAADVIRYEQEELGNTDLGVSPEKLKELENRPASDIVWVTRTKEAAAKYGDQREDIGAEPTPEEVANVQDYSKVVGGGEIISEIGPDGVLVLKPRVSTGPKTSGIPKPKDVSAQLIKDGHSIPKKLGWDDKTRRTFMKETTGKRSMSAMSLAEKQTYVDALKAEADKQGVDYTTAKKSGFKELVDSLINTIRTVGKKQVRGVINPEDTKALYPNKIRKILRAMKSGSLNLEDYIDKPEKIMEEFDGGKPMSGPFYKTFVEPLNSVANAAVNNNAATKENLIKFMQDTVGIDKLDDFVFKPKPIKGTNLKLTDADRIGIGMADIDEPMMRHLTNGNGFTVEHIQAIKASITPEDMVVWKHTNDWFLEHRTPLLTVLDIAAKAGPAGKIKIDAEQLRKQFMKNYFGLMLRDSSTDAAPDFFDVLTTPFEKVEISTPSRDVISERTGSDSPIETNYLKVFLHKSARVERFIQTAPTAAKLAKLMGNKKLRREINSRTGGKGVELVEKYIADTIRGTRSVDSEITDSTLEYMRQAGAAYAIKDNVLSVLRQSFLGGFNTLSQTPELIPHIIRNLVEYPKFFGLNKLRKFVYARSEQMKARENLPLTKLKAGDRALVDMLKGKSSIQRGYRMINLADEDAALHAWKWVYDYTMEKTGGNELEAVKQADYDSRTRQSNPAPQNLPGIFRSKSIAAKMLTTFNTEMAPLLNIYKNEIIRAKYRGEIGWGKAGYKVIVAHVLPATIMGIISRGRLPKDWKEIAKDMIYYAVSPTLFLANPIQQAITGVRTGLVAMAGPDALVGLAGNIKRLGDWDELTPKEKDILLRSLLKNTTKAVGGFTGKVSAQHIRSIEGLFDLITRKTNDWRRLVWSEKALEEPKGSEQVTGNTSRAAMRKGR
jgi:hypothetical protein